MTCYYGAIMVFFVVFFMVFILWYYGIYIAAPWLPPGGSNKKKRLKLVLYLSDTLKSGSMNMWLNLNFFL